MPPQLALFVWSVFLFLLLRWSKDRAESRALWIPVIWLLVISSRLPSQWLGLNPTSVVTAFEEGNSLDRIIYLTLIVLALWILSIRHVNWRELFAGNTALVLFLVFALASVVWSDFPYVSFKRWFRDLGSYVMILLVVSDPRPVVAISAVIRRFSSILLVMSLVLIKYYPALGVVYNDWTGSPEYMGATTSKNMLGVLCLISGLFLFWDTLGKWAERKSREAKRILVANIIVIAITLRLLMLSNSATSRGCLILGCLIIAIVRSKWAKANPRLVTAGIPVSLVGVVVLEFFFNISGLVAEFLGRDATFTGRTGMWDVLLDMQTNPLIGVGYQSFWMGDRLKELWSRLNVGWLNEAHNGYLETYLNLGIIGVFLLVVFMLSSFRTVSRQFTVSPYVASFRVAFWIITVFYNFTEAAFGASLLWFVLLLCVIVVPRSDEVMSRGTEVLVKRKAASALRYANRPASGVLRYGRQLYN